MICSGVISLLQMQMQSSLLWCKPLPTAISLDLRPDRKDILAFFLWSFTTSTKKLLAYSGSGRDCGSAPFLGRTTLGMTCAVCNKYEFGALCQSYTTVSFQQWLAMCMHYSSLKCKTMGKIRAVEKQKPCWVIATHWNIFNPSFPLLLLLVCQANSALLPILEGRV